jgi:hypothetical protein
MLLHVSLPPVTNTKFVVKSLGYEMKDASEYSSMGKLLTRAACLAKR